MLDKFKEIANKKGVQLENEPIQITGGRSGAQVWTMRLKGADLNGEYIVKLGESELEEEAKKLVTARKDGAFGGQFPVVRACWSEEDFIALIMSQGSGTAIDCQPLADDSRLFGATYSMLVPLMLPVNPDEKRLNGCHDFLTEALGRRLTKERIFRNLSKCCQGAVFSVPRFEENGNVLPNPLYIAFDDAPSAEKPDTFIYGPCHNDLHAGNIFVQANPTSGVKDICLIDLAAYQSTALLLRDFAYLEISILIDNTSSMGRERWLAVCRNLSYLDATGNEQTINPNDLGWVHAIQQGRNALRSWIDVHCPDLRDSIYRQLLLGQVAAALDFMGKKELASDKALLCLLYGAVYLQRYLETVALELPRTSSIPSLTPTVPDIENDVRIWQEADFALISPDTVNILIIDTPFRRLSTSEITKFFRIRWHLVLDFCSDPISGEVLDAIPYQLNQDWGGPEACIMPSTGGVWFFVRGRSDISDPPVTEDYLSWRKGMQRRVEVRVETLIQNNGFRNARILGAFDTRHHKIWEKILDRLDLIFPDNILAYILDKSNKDDYTPSPAYINFKNVPGLMDREGWLEQNEPKKLTIPTRQGENTQLQEMSMEDCRKIMPHLTLMASEFATYVPAGASMGLDFLKGGPPLMADLAQGTPVEREEFYTAIIKKVSDALGSKQSSTINLAHAPSAGGTTMARQIGWSLRQRYPVAIVHEYVPQLYEEISYLFQQTGLPVLVIMESGTIRERERDILAGHLRDDNVTSVFLWVGRSHDGGKNVLLAELDDKEAKQFFDKYEPYAKLPERKQDLVTITQYDRKQRSPFFYGFYTFQADYIGLNERINELVGMGPKFRDALKWIALASYYSSNGFPTAELWELFSSVEKEKEKLANSPIIYLSNRNIKIAHHLISDIILKRIVGNEDWKKQLSQISRALIDLLATLKNKDSKQVMNFVASLFMDRDTYSQMEQDLYLNNRKKYSRLVMDINRAPLQRELLDKIRKLWPSNPHFAVHWARHMLYEDPCERDRAYAVLELVSLSSPGKETSEVFQMLGMCKRSEAYALLADGGVETHVEQLKQCFDAGLKFFQKADFLEPDTLYGSVAILQFALHIFKKWESDGGQRVMDLLARRNPFALAFFDAAEQSLLKLEHWQHDNQKASKVIKEWSLLFENVEQLINRLENSHDTSPIERRMLSSTLLHRHKRTWTKIPEATLRKIAAAMEDNFAEIGIIDNDFIIWLNAKSRLASPDIDDLITRLEDWNNQAGEKQEAAYYLYIYRFLQYLQTGNSGYAKEATKWLEISRKLAPIGRKKWSNYWLTRNSSCKYGILSSRDLSDMGIDIHNLIIANKTIPSQIPLVRIEGTLSSYKGQQSATIDFGNGIKCQIVPGIGILREHVGRRVSMYISFRNEGLKGWDPKLTE